ncbi:MAG TPA: hypothetical protein VIV63_01490 [Steroidobacteraceae bacterium]
MIDTAPNIQTKNARLGFAPRGSTLSFLVQTGSGFEAEAILLLGTQTISTWVSSELVGKTATVELVSAGQYQLQITCRFTEKNLTNITIDLEVRAKGATLTSRSKNFTGTAPGTARAIADVYLP